MADQTWDPTEQTVKAVLAAYLHPDDNAPDQSVTAPTGKAAGSAADPSGQQPAGGAPPAAGGPPPPAGTGSPSPVQAPAQKKQFPRWDGPDYLALPKPEDKTMALGAQKFQQPRTPDELTDAEGTALRLESTVKANAQHVLMFGYKMPWVTRLDPKDQKVKDLIALIKEVRGRIQKVPIANLDSAPPAPGTPTQVSSNVADAGGPSNPSLSIGGGWSYQVLFKVQYNGTIHDVTIKADWKSSDDKILKVSKGLIQSTGKYTTAPVTITGTWNGITKSVDVEVTKKPKTNILTNHAKPTSDGRGTQTPGALNWMKWGGREGWAHDADDSKMQPPFSGQFREFALACSDPNKKWATATIIRKLLQEGSSAAVNTYDNMVLTLGSGNAADGALNVLAHATAKSADVKRLLYFCGFACEQESVPTGRSEPPHVVKMVDISDETNPRILWWDRRFHFYGWAVGRIPGGGNKGQPSVEKVKALEEPSKPLTFPDPGYTTDGALVENAGKPDPFMIFQHWTPASKPADDTYGTSKNNIEILHAIIALTTCDDPTTGKTFFDHDWAKSGGHTGHGLPVSGPGAPAGTVAIGLRAAYIFVGMVAHNWGYGTQIAFGRQLPSGKRTTAGFADTYLNKAELDLVKNGAADDPDRNALIAKACARAVAVTIEQARVAEAIRRAAQGKPGDLMKVVVPNTAFWGYGRVVNYWTEMTTGLRQGVGAPPGTAELSISKRLSSFMDNTPADKLTALLTEANMAKEDLAKACAEEGRVVLKANSIVFKDGFSMTPKTDGKFDFDKLYMQDITDNVARPVNQTANAIKGGYDGMGSAFYCVGPKASMPDLPPIIKAFDRGVSTVSAKAVGPQAFVCVWQITKPTDPNKDKFVLTNIGGEFCDEKGVKASDQATPIIRDTAPTL